VILKQGSSKAMAISQNNLSLILYYPNGTEVSLNSSSSTGTDDSDIIHVYCEEYEIYKINKQLFGNWNYSITSTYNNSREYLLMVNANTSTKFKILTEKTNYYTGEHVKINANLYNSTLDIEGANVTAYLTRPDKTTYNITLNDIGNGYYEGNFVNLFQNGIYEILVEAKKDDVIRQENFEFEMESIVNGGFETGDVSGWTVSSGGNGPEYYSEYEVAKEHNYSGNYGCELNISCALYGSSFISLTQNINLTNVAAVNFSHQCTYYYSNDGGRVRLQFYVDDNMTVIPLSDNVWK
jgi:hypothetical protein